MSWTNRVVWREGMFLRPQHFQQQDRYIHSLFEHRTAALRPFAWGVTELEFDRALFKHGKISLARCTGIFDDGTPFEIPDGNEPAPILEVASDAANMQVFLVALRARGGATDAAPGHDAQPLARYRSALWRVPDSNSDTTQDAEVEVGKLNVRLVLERDRLSDETAICVGRIAKIEDDGSVVLDDKLIPPCLDCFSQPRLQALITETEGMLRVRADYLAQRIVEGARGGVSEVAKYLLLQLVNRYEPLFAHWRRLRGLHPVDLYATALQLAGEISTFNADSKRPPAFPAYRHDQLYETMRPVFKVIAEELTRVPEETATEIPLKSDSFGFRVAVLGDLDIGGATGFVLAAKADMPTESLRRDFPPLVTIGAPQQITQLVKSHLPGVGLFPLPTTPPQIPFHAGYTYFELDRNSQHWGSIETSKGLALHVPEKFPGLALGLWAIKH